MGIRVLEFLRQFAKNWSQASRQGRVTLAVLATSVVSMALLTIAGLWFLYLATMRTAAAEGTNPLWMFGSYALIAVAFGVCGWFMIRAQQRQYQREEREDQEKHARTMARLDRLQMDLDAIAGRTPPMRPTNRTSVPYLKLVE